MILQASQPSLKLLCEKDVCSFNHYCSFSPFRLSLVKPNQNRITREPKARLIWEGTRFPGLCVASISWDICATLTSRKLLSREWKSLISQSETWVFLMASCSAAPAGMSWVLQLDTVLSDLQPLCHLVPTAVLRGQYCHCPHFRMVESDGWRGLLVPSPWSHSQWVEEPEFEIT